MAVENKYGDWIKAGWEHTKGDLVPWALTTFVMGLCGICFIIFPQVGANYLKMIREYKNNGTKPEMGKLFVFDNVVQYLIALVIMAVAQMLCIIPVFLVFWTIPLMAFKGMGAVDAAKASYNYVKGNFVSTLLLAIVLGFVQSIGNLACGLGGFVTIPIAAFAWVYAYEAHEAAIDAAQAGA